MPRLSALALVMLLAACAHAPPQRALPTPMLAPAALAMEVSLSQRLVFTSDRGGPIEVLDAQLEIDAQTLRLAGFALGQRVLGLQWDGEELSEQRSPQLPATVAAAQILRDIQLVYAPDTVLQAVLPAGWQVRDHGLRREIAVDGRSAMMIEYATMPRWNGAVTLHNRLEGYRLDIETVADSLESN